MKWWPLLLLWLPAVGADHLDDGSYRCDGGWCLDGKDHVVYCSDVGCTGDTTGFATIENPRFGDGAWLDGDDLVLGLSHGDIHRAYPLRIISGVQGWEMVVDDLGGQPVVVTYCPLCASPIAYSSVLDGQVLSLRNSGAIWQFDLVMYDASGSQWSQVSGEALDGPHHGKHLRLIDQSFTTWDAWRERHLDTVAMERPLDPDGRLLCSCPSFQLAPSSLVTGIEHQGAAYAFRNGELAHVGIQHIDTPDGGLVAVWDDGVHVFLAAGRTFTWDGRLHDGARAYDLGDPELHPVPTRTTFAHRWELFFPDTAYPQPATTPAPAQDAPALGMGLAAIAVMAALRARRG